MVTPSREICDKRLPMPAKTEKENPNAFKLWINRDVLERLARSIREVQSDFDSKSFVALAPKLDPLELKPRVQLVRDQLRQQLPEDFPAALDILMASIKKKDLKGFTLWPYTEFVQTFGIEHRDESLVALRKLTELFTSEFAVRPFLKRHTNETLRFLEQCAVDTNVHVRRWSSEGSRPRLPWGERLDIFITNPRLTLPILDLLKFDDEIYVRKSVANHLNDISKDHPALVVKTLKQWATDAKGSKDPVGNTKKVDWITRHSLRTLIKKGDKGALALIGTTANAAIKASPLKLNRSTFKVGDRLEFEFVLRSTAKKPQSLIVDYVIHYVKSNGKTAPKVFKLKSLKLAANEAVTIKKIHHLKAVTTRRHYPGQHAVAIQVNGAIAGKKIWTLIA